MNHTRTNTMPAKKRLRTTALALGAGLMMSSAALASFNATATTDLNIRSGPGPQYPVVGVIDNNSAATVNGCMQGSKWCQVAYNGTTGWAYSDYLMTNMSGNASPVAQLPASASVPTVSYDDQATNATVGAAGGAITGALIGGPVGAAVGGVVGAGLGAAATPPDQVRTYVTQNRVDPVYLDGEVVVGAQVPQDVALYQVPDYQYEYVYVNGQPVLIDPQTRQIVHVYR
ncbi:DUF1236 domain-containing protein [Microbaculum marinum]|uniref:DUF1236 domain-containing protein n=1 Tax=Microbaculum marinum TaxID=1764581 RepID=A0AAW9RV86_9HYPH